MVITTKIYNLPSATYAVEYPDWSTSHYYALLCIFNLKISELSPGTGKYLHKKDNSHANIVRWHIPTGHSPAGHQTGVRLKDLYLNSWGWRSYRALQEGSLSGGHLFTFVCLFPGQVQCLIRGQSTMKLAWDFLPKCFFN